jgi:hypothetical protein
MEGTDQRSSHRSITTATGGLQEIVKNMSNPPLWKRIRRLKVNPGWSEETEQNKGRVGNVTMLKQGELSVVTRKGQREADSIESCFQNMKTKDKDKNC